MIKTKLGRLKQVGLRAVWEREDGDFTPWLAQEDNLKLLSDTIGLDLQLESIEKPVGPYRADIVCKDTVNGSPVIIENQIEATDHTHLGQILTYAAGLTPVTVVWIAKEFTDEHRAALDWLNNVTTENISFFGLEVELWQIGDSPPAPKFNIVSKPNIVVKTNVRPPAPSGAQQLQREFWAEFMPRLRAESKLIKPRSPLPQMWMDFAIGRAYVTLQAFMSVRLHHVGVSLMIVGPNKAAYFHQLRAQKKEIEAELGEALTWYELPDKKSSYVSLYRKNSDPNDRTQWPEQHQWMIAKLDALHRCFSSRVKSLAVPDEPTAEPSA